MDVYDFDKKTRLKYTGYEKIYQSPIINHPNMEAVKDHREKWNGEYLEYYPDAVARLSQFQ